MCSEALGNTEKAYASSMNMKEIHTFNLLTNFSYSSSQLETRDIGETVWEWITGFEKLPLGPFQTQDPALQNYFSAFLKASVSPDNWTHG